jgi:hypothetical protein
MNVPGVITPKSESFVGDLPAPRVHFIDSFLLVQRFRSGAAGFFSSHVHRVLMITIAHRLNP